MLGKQSKNSESDKTTKIASESIEKQKRYRLLLALEFIRKPVRFELPDFEALVLTAIKTVLGISCYTSCRKTYFLIQVLIVGVSGQSRNFEISNDFDAHLLEGSVFVDEKDLKLIWAALSIYGDHFGTTVAVRLKKLFQVQN